jgi:Major Facilitator Superfamily
MTSPTTTTPIRLGLRANLPQFTLLVALNALVGGMIGQERTVLPLLAEHVFALDAFTATLTYIVAFGITKALTNLAAGSLSDRYGRKPVLVAGWLIGLPVPLILIWAPQWGWVVAANVLLGINQGLTWSTTIVMKIDLVGPSRRGLAMGLNEAAGYTAVAATALATGWLAAQYGLRPAPFYLGIAFAALGLGLSTVFVRETHHHARHEARHHRAHSDGTLGTRQIFTLTSFRERALSAASQAGMVNNLNDGLAWGVFPILFASSGLNLTRIGVLAAIYPAVWGLGQTVTGALSDGGAENGSSLLACSFKVPALLSSRSPPASPPGPLPLRSWAPAPPWSTPPCSPSSATSPTPPGGPAPSGSTGSGATPAMRLARSSRASPPTCSACAPPCG